MDKPLLPGSPPYYLFFDIDGTIATENRPPSKAFVEALLLLRQKGHKCFICTGRPYCDVYGEVLNAGFDGIVCATGSYIEAEGQPLYKYVIPFGLLRRTLDTLARHKVTTILEGSRRLWLMDGNAPLPEYVTYLAPEPYDPAQLCPEMEIQSFTLHTREAAEIDALRPVLEKDYRLYCAEDGQYSEMVVKGQTKAAALKRVLAHYGAKTEQSIAFGDSMNDYGLLQKAGFGVAMGDAPAKLRKAADFVTGTLQEEGVVSALKRLGLI